MNPAAGEGTSTLQKIRRSLRSESVPEDSEFSAGGRYKVRTAVTMRASADLNSSRIAELAGKDEVLLLSVDIRDSTEVGLVVPALPERPGWIVLRSPSQQQCALVLRKLEGSWDLKARYRATRPATLRREASIKSECLGEVSPGDEVLILNLSLDDGDEDKPRLRAQVSVIGTELIGWISPETYSGDRLLDPVNLLGPEVVKIHRRSLNGSKSPREAIGQRLMSIRGGKANRNGSISGPQRSCVPGEAVPWEVGGRYRVLEELTARERPELTSTELFKVPAGAVATVMDVQIAECTSLGWCPCALVLTEEGAPHGWVRCAAKDGRDLMDTRDQLEFEKVQNRLRTSQQSKEAADAQEANREGLEASVDTSNPNDGGMGIGGGINDPAGSATGLGQMGQELFMEKLEALEEGKEDRLVQDTAFEGRNPLCTGCTCGSNQGI